MDADTIVSLMREFSYYYSLTGDTIRESAWDKAADAIEEYGGVIPNGEWAMKNISDVGKSSAELIDLAMKGDLPEKFKILRQTYSHMMSYIQSVEQYYGIGKKKAAELYKKGLMTKDQILQYGDLTDAQKAGILWYEHLSRPINRMEMDMIKEEIDEAMLRIKALIGVMPRYQLAGSYRRGKSSSGDVDLIVERVDGLSMGTIYSSLAHMLPVVFKMGDKILEAVVRISDYLYGHKMDILLVDSSEWAGALLHFTGSKKFNISMANLALSKGYRLGRRGLIPIGSSTPYPAKNEEEIFSILGIEYTPPENRDL